MIGEEVVHYLAGFGLAPMRLEAHEPPAPGFAPRRATLEDEVLTLPDVGEDARLARAAVAHAVAHRAFSARRRPAGNRQPMLVAMMSLIEDARVERLMLARYPGLRGLWGLFHTATAASVGFDFYGLAARLSHALHDPSYADPNVWVHKGRALFEQAWTDGPTNGPAFDHLARQLAIDIEKMRLPFAPATYRPLPLYRDDNTWLWDFNTPSLDDPVETTILRRYEVEQDHPADWRENLRLVEVDPGLRTNYPEWDCHQQRLLDDWTTVIEAAAPAKRERPARWRPPARARVIVKGLAQSPDRSVRLNRLEEGDELDLNAAVDSVVARASRVAPDPRIFRRHGRRRRNAAIVLLMDLSKSTERFVPGSFTKVLDVEKRAVRLVADSLDGSRDRVAVHGFSSNGREEVHYVRIKSFDEPFGAPQTARLMAETGRLSTRMGAALRHAGATLRDERADRKLILLLTDGEPSDVDVEDADYLVEDARHAVTTAATQGIKTFCLTLDRHADAYVRRIFGERNYLIADQAASFAGHATQALMKLISH